MKPQKEVPRDLRLAEGWHIYPAINIEFQNPLCWVAFLIVQGEAEKPAVPMYFEALEDALGWAKSASGDAPFWCAAVNDDGSGNAYTINHGTLPHIVRFEETTP